MSEAATTAVAIRDETSAVMLTNAQLTMIANTSFVPAAFRGKVPEVLACVATGRALGLPDMTALRGINIIEGKASLSAELMDAIVRAHGHSITGSVDEAKAVVRGKRADNGDEMEAMFTLEMAEKAGLLGKNNWVKHPDDMMWARAVSKLCRRLFADCFAGATYVPEEVEATADETLDVPWDGALAGPGSAAPSGDIGTPAPGKPSTAGSDVAPGSASPWQQLTELAARSGVERSVLEGAGREMFPGRTRLSLSEGECGELWARVEAGLGVEA